MMIESFITVWHVIAIFVALMGSALAVGIWIGTVSADRSSLQGYLSEVHQDFCQNRETVNRCRETVNRCRDDVNAVRQDMNQIRNDMAEIKKILDEILERLPFPPTTAPSGPIRLTDFGRNVSASLSIGEWAASHAEHLKNDASGKPEFEVFEMCVEHVSGQFDKDLKFRRTIREGAYEQSADVENEMKICAVELRDALLARVNS